MNQDKENDPICLCGHSKHLHSSPKDLFAVETCSGLVKRNVPGPEGRPRCGCSRFRKKWKGADLAEEYRDDGLRTEPISFPEDSPYNKEIPKPSLWEKIKGWFR